MNSILCPACKSPEHHHEADNRYQCDRCYWRFIIDRDGIARDWLPWRTAGRKNRSNGRNSSHSS